jgi:hypothetical protein
VVEKRAIYTAGTRAGKEKRASYELLFPVSRRVQINFIFPDDVRALYLHCNVKHANKMLDL